ncbi:MAG: Tuberous sclerosis 2-like protein [Icmadophila ericetorum]|nr:Tuberous sclerosis 2-like protein [Icmadophila ericetorum]
MSHIIDLRGKSNIRTLESSSIASRYMNPLPLNVTNDATEVPSATAIAELPDRTRELTSVDRLRRTASRGGGTASQGLRDGISEAMQHTMAGRRMERVDPEVQFRENSIRNLDSSKRTAERVEAARTIAPELVMYSVDTLMAVWTAAEDLLSKDASSDARKAGYVLLKNAASHTGLGLQEREKFFKLIMVPVEPSCVRHQIEALRLLVDHGHNLDPFENEIVEFVNKALRDQFDSVRTRRSTLKSQRHKIRGALPEEEGLDAVVAFISSIINTNSEAFSGGNLATLIEGTLSIAAKTTAKKDMEDAMDIIVSLISKSLVPPGYLKSCIETLCAILYTVDGLARVARDSIFTLLRDSVYQLQAMQSLDEIVTRPTEEQGSGTVRGALEVCKRLYVNNGESDLPRIEFTRLMTAYWEVVHSFSPKLQRDCLRKLVELLEDKRTKERLLEEDWRGMFRILYGATGSNVHLRDKPDNDSSGTNSVSSFLQRVSSAETREKMSYMAEIVDELRNIAGLFVMLWPRLSKEKRAMVASYFRKMRIHLPVQALQLFIEHTADEGSIFPGRNGWEVRLADLVNSFLLDRTNLPVIRCSIVYLLGNIHPQLSTPSDKEHFRELVANICVGLSGEQNVRFANEFAVFATSYAKIANDEITQLLVKVLRSMTALEDLSPEIPTESIINTVAASLVRLFLHCLPVLAKKAVMVYNVLVDLAASSGEAPSARLTALKLLMRLRCNSSHSVLITPIPDSLKFAATLCRTEDSAVPQGFSYPYRNSTSASDDQQILRPGRTSAMSLRSPGGSRQNARSASGHSRNLRPTPPLWMYPGGPGLPEDPPVEPSQVLKLYESGADQACTLKLSDWFITVISILQRKDDWEIYSYILVHLPSQLSNHVLFVHTIPYVQTLRSVVTDQLRSNSFHEPPENTGVKKGDVALCLVYALIILVGYNQYFGRNEQDDIVRTFLTSIRSWDRVAKTCIHALTICCYETPQSVGRYLADILAKFAQIITQSHLAVDILEFLGGVARLPIIKANLAEDELRTVFAICIRYLEYAREQRIKLANGIATSANYTSNRYSDLSGEIGLASESSQSTDVHRDLPQYVFQLAYHVITFWFLSIRLVDRSKHVGWITKNLAWKDSEGSEIMEEQSQVALDMMHRTAYLDLGETSPGTIFNAVDGQVLRKSWLFGMSIVTVETAVRTGLTQLTKRQASGTTYATYQQQTAALPSHHIPIETDFIGSAYGSDSRVSILPNHVFLQLTSTIAPTPTPMEAICLPDNEITRRAISTFDRSDTVDGYKIGVVYIGCKQISESEILANTRGSQAFENLLAGLGARVGLRGAKFNTQGLDRESDLDGTHTYAWRDRLTEIVYHVSTMMPTNLENDPQCVNKKRHLGNDYVNIHWNESGLPFQYNASTSQFNYVNIVVTPDGLLFPELDAEADQFAEQALPTHFKVQMFFHPSLPQVSPVTSYKLISAAALPSLVRQVAFNAAVFCLVWQNRAEGENISSWRARLRQIAMLRKRFAGTGTSTSAKFPGAKGDKTYKEGDRWRGIVAMGGLAEEEGILSGLDFSRWAGPNPSLF